MLFQGFMTETEVSIDTEQTPLLIVVEFSEKRKKAEVTQITFQLKEDYPYKEHIETWNKKKEKRIALYPHHWECVCKIAGIFDSIKVHSPWETASWVFPEANKSDSERRASAIHRIEENYGINLSFLE